MAHLLRVACAALLAAALCGCQYLPGDVGESAAAFEEAALKPVTEEAPSAPLLIGEYLEPPAPDFAAYRKPVEARGIYVTANIASIREYYEPRLELLKTTELNAVVIDIKNDEGYITVAGKLPLAEETATSSKFIGDIDALISELKANGIYSIARVVVFKDSQLYKARPDFAIQMNKNGKNGVYRAYYRNGDNGDVWLNPYNRELWDYYVELSKQISALGFDEIQYDYIRFPTDRNVQYADYGDEGGLSKTEVLTAFAAYLCDGLKGCPVRLSADIFATVIHSDYDASLIGQDPIALSRVFDIVCPMIYPSHYSPGSMGLQYPDLEPYETLYRATARFLERQAEEIPAGEHVAVIRPWLQDFSFSGTGHMPYGAKEVREQIQAVYDAGLNEWLLWNAANKYTADALLPKE